MEQYLQAVFLIFIAEMGDKTQLLAMAFATKYRIKTVLLGIFIGAFLNHGIAVLLGYSLGSLLNLDFLSILAGALFIIFGLWSLQADDEEVTSKMTKYGPIITVSLAFFIGELGDKTQLTAITLASISSHPLYVLLGTVSGMVLTGSLGIFVGMKLGSKVPEFMIKVGSSVIFIGVGIFKLFNSLDSNFVTWYYVLIVLVVVSGLFLFLLQKLKSFYQQVEISSYKQTAKTLYDYYHDISQKFEDICLGLDVCGKCDENSCLIGYMKTVIKNAKENKKINIEEDLTQKIQKRFNSLQVQEALYLTIKAIKDEQENNVYLHHIRQALEQMLYKRSNIEYRSFIEYITYIDKYDKTFSKRLRNLV